MANRLKNIRLTSVDLVRSGANQLADICLYKSAVPPGQNGRFEQLDTIQDFSSERFDLIVENERASQL